MGGAGRSVHAEVLGLRRFFRRHPSYDGDESITPVPMDSELLSLLRCPQTGGILRAATSAELERINAAIRNSAIRNQAGEVISDILNDCLICDSAGLCYPVRDDLPLLIAGEAFGSPR